MSTSTTLAALQALFAAQLPGVSVLDSPQNIPYEGALPALIFSPYRDYVEREYPGLRGNDPDRPNLYSFAYLRQLAQVQGVSLPTAVGALYSDMETLKATFSTEANETLPDSHGVAQALWAGGQLILEYDRSGPFIEYLGQQYIGVYGTISVLELYRTDH